VWTDIHVVLRFCSKIVRDTPVLLSDELTGSLRKLKPKGDPLLDRFDSLHKRNMIVANHSRAKGKKKVKIVPVKK
jgi:nucleolar protein 53